MMKAGLPDGLPSASSTMPNGCLNTMRQPLSPLASIVSSAANIFCPRPSRWPQRFSDAITSADATGLPSWNARPLRNVKVQVFASGDALYLSTICGCSLPLASRPNKVS